MHTNITILAERHEGKPIRETIPAKKLDNNRYQALASPGFANGFAAGDILELLDSDGHFRVTQRAGNVCVQIFYEGDKNAAIEEFGKRFKALGGWLDGGKDAETSHLLIYTVPREAGFSKIERALQNVPPKIKMETWMYGNVYDDDGSPLNWWN